MTQMRTASDKLQAVNNFIAASPLPVHVVPLANSIGIKVYKAPWPSNVSGKIQRDPERGGDSGFAIFVNQSHPPVRRRFTIAHEVAHYVLHEPLIGDGVYDDALYRSGLPATIETQANALATDMLMPWSLLNPQIEAGITSVSKLADIFQVSESAMSIRLGVPSDD